MLSSFLTHLHKYWRIYFQNLWVLKDPSSLAITRIMFGISRIRLINRIIWTWFEFFQGCWWWLTSHTNEDLLNWITGLVTQENATSLSLTFWSHYLFHGCVFCIWRCGLVHYMIFLEDIYSLTHVRYSFNTDRCRGNNPWLSFPSQLPGLYHSLLVHSGAG